MSAQETDYKILELTFEKEVINLGTFSEDSGPKECVFKFRNNTDVPITIDMIVTSCGCTKVEYSTKPIMASKTGGIKVMYSNDRGAQELNERITVYVNTTAKAANLKIIGTVTEAPKH